MAGWTPPPGTWCTPCFIGTVSVGSRASLRQAVVASASDKIGVGTYRLTNDVAGHQRALTLALESGVRHIDTASSWSDGRAEQLVGDCLEALIKAKRLRREDVTLTSKAGYLEGRNLRRLQAAERLPEAVPFSEHGLYSLDPEFIRSEVSESLGRMRTDYVDHYLLQNPEVHLEASMLLDGITTPSDERVAAKYAEFEVRLEQAFAELERQCSSGRIRGYGISSDAFVADWDQAPTGLPWTRILPIAESAAASVGCQRHHLQVVEMPANLLERSALQPGGAAHWAKANGLEVKIVRPLNAFSEARGQSMRLADSTQPRSYDVLLEALLKEMDEYGMAELAPLIRQCDAIRGDFKSVVDFEVTMSSSIMPAITDMLRQRIEINAAVVAETDKYFDVLHQWIKWHCSSAVADEVQRLQEDGAFGEFQRRQGESLQHFALRWLLAQDELVDVVLVGMPKETQVRDVLAVNVQ